MDAIVKVMPCDYDAIPDNLRPQARRVYKLMASVTLRSTTYSFAESAKNLLSGIFKGVWEFRVDNVIHLEMGDEKFQLTLERVGPEYVVKIMYRGIITDELRMRGMIKVCAAAAESVVALEAA